jgi:hypothetical protein
VGASSQYAHMHVASVNEKAKAIEVGEAVGVIMIPHLKLRHVVDVFVRLPGER